MAAPGPAPTKAFRDLLREKIVVFDGAMGTSIQARNPTPDDYGGERYAGCNELLVATRPSMIREIHAEYLEAGADVIETDTFGASAVVLAEYGLTGRVRELNAEAARLARETAAQFSTPARPRYVAGSLGPTTRLPTLGQISFQDLEQAFYDQTAGLVEGGVDLLVVETCQDPLQAKAALAGVRRRLADARIDLPVIVSVTVEQTGAMLLGTEIAAALTALEPFRPDLIGMNCATGPKEMSESVRHLCSHSAAPVFVMPNAGLPENVGGRAHYRLSPEEFVRYLGHFVADLGVAAVGGCCGTTAEHIRALAAAVGSRAPSERRPAPARGSASLYHHAPYRIVPAPTLVGERTNANGSRKFRDLLAGEDWEGMTAMGKEQAREGAHLLDVCVAYVGRDEARDMRELIPRLNTQVKLPLMVDSTEPPVIEEALRRISGKPIVNSVNFEDGGERLHAVLALCRRYGAAVVALTIDERGMAKTVDRKVEIAGRLIDAAGGYGIPPWDVIVDPLTFTLGSGDAEFRDAGIATLEAIRGIKARHPDVQTSLGVSNISFGLSPRARTALNSVFLHHAIEAGLDMAIVHASKILPLYRIPEQEREACRRLIFDERREGDDPLTRLLAVFSGGETVRRSAGADDAPVDERLRRRIVDGDRTGLTKDLDAALAGMPALAIINDVLLDGMKTVGDLFGSGQMQLPFVLQSAEVMKAAVSYLEGFMDKAESTSKGTIVLATVKGDVHDIGKNLVDIILTNNGYRVINLGIQCPLETMLHAWREHAADAIGMSGLLVKSTLIMKENLEVLTERNLRVPVILGGAALTRRYVEQDLQQVYPGMVFYARDAFDGLRLMERIRGGSVDAAAAAPVPAAGPDDAPSGDDPGTGYEAKILLARPDDGAGRGEPPSRPAPADVPSVPFFGSKVVDAVPLERVYEYINETALIRGQWQVRRGALTPEQYDALLREKVLPELRDLQEFARREELLRPAVVYGYYPCRSDGDDLVVFGPADRGGTNGTWAPAGAVRLAEVLRFRFPRQRRDRRRSIADFFRSGEDGGYDVLGMQLVTVGSRASEHARGLFAADRYREYLYFHGLSVEAAEGLAEYWHKRVREEMGIAGADAAEVRRLFSQQYRGSRYSFGYPACPSLEDQEKLFALLDPARIGVELTEQWQLVPEQSTSAIIVHHPEARYFTL